MVEDLALCSALMQPCSLKNLCWDWQQVFQMLSLIVWLESSDTVLWLVLYRDMIMLLIHCFVLVNLCCFFFALCWWICSVIHVNMCNMSLLFACMCTKAGCACNTFNRSVFVLNSKEILLDLPLHLLCVMSLPAMWCCSLSDWQDVIKKSNTWPHLHWTDESKV